jgi:hypothetical protein
MNLNLKPLIRLDGFISLHEAHELLESESRDVSVRIDVTCPKPLNDLERVWY